MSVERLFSLLVESSSSPDWDHIQIPYGEFYDLLLKLSEQGSPGEKHDIITHRRPITAQYRTIIADYTN